MYSWKTAIICQQTQECMPVVNIMDPVSKQQVFPLHISIPFSSIRMFILIVSTVSNFIPINWEVCEKIKQVLPSADLLTLNQGEGHLKAELNDAYNRCAKYEKIWLNVLHVMFNI